MIVSQIIDSFVEMEMWKLIVIVHVYNLFSPFVQWYSFEINGKAAID